MAYFTQDMKSELVQRLKNSFPDWKFSVSVKDASSVIVKIKSAPIDLWSNFVENVGKENLYGDNGYTSINQYYLENQFDGVALEEMQRLRSHINLEGSKNANYSNSDVRSDYTDVGYYYSIKIGYSNEKVFEYIPTVEKVKKKKM